MVSTILQLHHPWEKPGAQCTGGWVGFEVILLQVIVTAALS